MITPSAASPAAGRWNGVPDQEDVPRRGGPAADAWVRQEPTRLLPLVCSLLMTPAVRWRGWGAVVTGGVERLLCEVRSDKQAVATIRTAYGLVADAMTAQFDGGRAGMDKAIAQVAKDPDRAATACDLLVGLLGTKERMTAAVLRQHAREVAGPSEQPTDSGGGGSS